MDIKNYINSQECKELKQTCQNEYKKYKNGNEIAELEKVFKNPSFEVILTNKFKYEFIPFSIELLKHKKGKVIKKIPKNKRYVENFFLDNELYAQKWEIQGNKELFGSYIELSRVRDNFKELYFIQADKDDNFRNLVSYTRILRTNKYIFYLSINGLGETNWHLRIDTLKNEKIDIISRFDPIFNLETSFTIQYSNDKPTSIIYNNSVYFTIA